MKNRNNKTKEAAIQDFMLRIFEDRFEKKAREIEQEKKVLVDKFEIHVKGKKILLENSK